MCVTSASSKTLRNHFQKARLYAPKFPENLKNILGAGGWCEPNIFPITALLMIFVNHFVAHSDAFSKFLNNFCKSLENVKMTLSST